MSSLLHGSFELFCYILEKSHSPFSIDIKDSETMDVLKEMILEINQNKLVGVDADQLKLWKHYILPSKDLRTQMGNVRLSDEDSLQATELVSSTFSDALRGYIHVIVKAPSYTTSSEVLEIDALQPQIQKTLGIIRLRIETFLKNPELPGWDPPSTNPTGTSFLPWHYRVWPCHGTVIP